MPAKVHMVTMEDMHREPTPPWVADRLKQEIVNLRCEVIRLKNKCGETVTGADFGFPDASKD